MSESSADRIRREDAENWAHGLTDEQLQNAANATFGEREHRFDYAAVIAEAKHRGLWWANAPRRGN